MQPDMQQQALSAQNEQLLQQNQQLDEQYEQLTNEITWDRIEKFFKQDKLVSFLITAPLDDLENKLINDDKKNSDMEYLNTIINLVHQIIQNVNNNPQFADIYTSMFSLCIDNFITDLKKFAKQKVDKPPPPDVSIQNKLQELQLKHQQDKRKRLSQTTLKIRLIYEISRKMDKGADGKKLKKERLVIFCFLVFMKKVKSD